MFLANDLTFEEFIASDDPRDDAHTNELRKTKRRNHVLSIISTAISLFLNDINKKDVLSNEQVVRTAGMILEDYPRLQLGDMKYWLRCILREQYGQVYNVSIPLFLGWIKRYWEDRSIAYSDYVYELDKAKERAERETLGTDAVEMPENIKELMEKLKAHKDDSWKAYLETR